MKSIYKITLLFMLFPLLLNANNDEKKHEKTGEKKKIRVSGHVQY